jgi:hypothetical protein
MYLSVDTPSLRPFQSSRPEADKASTIKDLRVLCSFERALQRLNEEVPPETYQKFLESEMRFLGRQGSRPNSGPTLTLIDAAAELLVLVASMP